MVRRIEALQADRSWSHQLQIPQRLGGGRLERLPAGHGHHARAQPFAAQPGGGLERDVHLAAAGQQHDVRPSPVRLQHVRPLPEALRPRAAPVARPAALQARFSRPIPAESLQQGSRLEPALEHRWLGRGDNLLLSLGDGQRLAEPLQLDLAGRDGRGLSLPASRWLWDPRPRVMAVVSEGEGEQLQLRHHDGSWSAISPVWPSIPVVIPLGNGSGVAAASQRSR